VVDFFFWLAQVRLAPWKVIQAAAKIATVSAAALVMYDACADET
jgi:hypothetical protein